jgi:hypothetical protein
MAIAQGERIAAADINLSAAGEVSAVDDGCVVNGQNFDFYHKNGLKIRTA